MTQARPFKVPILLIDETDRLRTAYDSETDAVLDARELEARGHAVRVLERRRSEQPPGIAMREIYPVLRAWVIES